MIVIQSYTIINIVIKNFIYFDTEERT